MPHAVRVAVLINPAYTARTRTTVNEAEDAARVLGLQIQIFKASSDPRDQCRFRNFLAGKA